MESIDTWLSLPPTVPSSRTFFFLFFFPSPPFYNLFFFLCLQFRVNHFINKPAFFASPFLTFFSVFLLFFSFLFVPFFSSSSSSVSLVFFISSSLLLLPFFLHAPSSVSHPLSAHLNPILLDHLHPLQYPLTSFHCIPTPTHTDTQPARQRKFIIPSYHTAWMSMLLPPQHPSII